MFSNEYIVIWDDFRGDCYEAQELFKLCDRYDYKVQIKGGFMNFNSKVIIFTNNADGVYLYRDTIGLPFERRIDCKFLINMYNGIDVKYTDVKNVNEG